ncbi:hypothetical protein [Flavobacterium sp. N2038]|nr:hypothetical protein [Flavobacterium sp. N2038]
MERNNPTFGLKKESGFSKKIIQIHVIKKTKMSSGIKKEIQNLQTAKNN